MSAKAILTGEQARFLPSALLRKGHCKHTWARNAKGECVPITDPDAVQYCVMATISVCAMNTQYSYERLKTQVHGVVLASMMAEGTPKFLSVDEAIIDWSDTFETDHIVKSLEEAGL